MSIVVCTFSLIFAFTNTCARRRHWARPCQNPVCPLVFRVHTDGSPPRPPDFSRQPLVTHICTYNVSVWVLLVSPLASLSVLHRPRVSWGRPTFKTTNCTFFIIRSVFWVSGSLWNHTSLGSNIWWLKPLIREVLSRWLCRRFVYVTFGHTPGVVLVRLVRRPFPKGAQVHVSPEETYPRSLSVRVLGTGPPESSGVTCYTTKREKIYPWA